MIVNRLHDEGRLFAAIIDADDIYVLQNSCLFQKFKINILPPANPTTHSLETIAISQHDQSINSEFNSQLDCEEMSSPSRRQSICAGQNQAGASHAATEGTARVGDGNKNMVAAEECRSAESQNIPTIENDDSPRTQRSQRTGTPCLTSRERRPVTEPPVTKATLSELDVTKIVNNPKLRHDINFDPELHFRPNIDGEKGKRKSQKANAFWDHMENQLGSYLTETEKFERENGDAEWALPATLRAIREILETLVPQRDRSSVEETFNIELLMQQFRNGVADMTKLSHWLSQLLKSHCAPMRDEWVDKMVVQFTHGDQNQDIRSSVEGMKTLLGILEAMKLVRILQFVDGP